jgi:hypothetical protein
MLGAHVPGGTMRVMACSAVADGRAAASWKETSMTAAPSMLWLAREHHEHRHDDERVRAPERQLHDPHERPPIEGKRIRL